MAERAPIDDQAQARERYYSTSTEDSMSDTASLSSLSFLGDSTLWTEDITWLAQKRASDVFGHRASRVRWVHLYIEPARHHHGGGVLVRIQHDLAGQELCSVAAIRACPQAALCAAFDLLREQIECAESIAV